MTCRHAELQLNALADQELSPWQALRVRRHLAACPACAAEYAGIRRLDASVQAWRDLPAPSALGTRIAAALPPSAVPSTPRRPFPLRPAAVGLAGIAAVTAAAMWFLPGQPGQPTIAYADVVKAMANVKIMGRTEDNTFYYANGTVRHHNFRETWVRTDPPTVAVIIFPTSSHPYREQSLETAKGTTYIAQNGEYTTVDNIHKVSDDVRSNLIPYAQALDVFAQPGSVLPKYLGGSQKVLIWERTTLNGQSVVEFKAKTTGMCLYPAAAPGQLPQTNVMADYNSTVWIDSKTHRIVQMESHATTQGKPIYDIKEYNVSYDQLPPPGIFDQFPPPGAKVTDKRRRVQQK